MVWVAIMNGGKCFFLQFRFYERLFDSVLQRVVEVSNFIIHLGTYLLIYTFHKQTFYLNYRAKLYSVEVDS